MGVNYEKERAIEAINYLLDNNMVWARLDDVADKYFVTTNYIRKEMESYLHELSLNDPENELLRRYNSALVEKKNARKPNTREGIIKEILNLNISDFENYFTSLSKSSLDIRVKLVSELLSDATGKYDLNFIRIFGNSLIEFINRPVVKKVPEKQVVDRFKELVEYYINSSDVLIKKPVMFLYGYTPDKFKTKLAKIKSSIDNNTDEFDEDTKKCFQLFVQLYNSRKITAAKIMKEVAYNIINGVKRADGIIDNYTRYDYLNTNYGISLNDLAKTGPTLVKDGLVVQTDYRRVESFRVNIGLKREFMTPSYRISIAGRIISDDEHKAICDYMTAKGYPLEVDIYNSVVREFVAGRININVMNK